MGADGPAQPPVQRQAKWRQPDKARHITPLLADPEQTLLVGVFERLKFRDEIAALVWLAQKN